MEKTKDDAAYRGLSPEKEETLRVFAVKGSPPPQTIEGPLGSGMAGAINAKIIKSKRSRQKGVAIS